MKIIFKAVLSGDIKVFYLINNKIKCKVLDFLMPKITHLGGALFTITFALLMLIFGGDRFKQVGWEAIVALIASGVVVQIIKQMVNRKRPYQTLDRVNLINPPFCMRSFPSGHTTAVFSIAVVLAANFPQLNLLIKSVAGVVGLSRAYVGVHYPSDILTGALIGIYFSNLVYVLV